MRISEKTVEINVCADIAVLLSPYRRIVWFGLTQKQEARAGFDACTRLGAKLVVLQFKASNKVKVSTGARQFKVKHDQLERLKALAQRCVGPGRGVFYVFPTIGNTQELSMMNGNWLDNTQYVDVSTLPSGLATPTRHDGNLRRTGVHYVDLVPGTATFHSKPIEVPSLPGSELFGGAGAATGRPSGRHETLNALSMRQSGWPGLEGIGVLAKSWDGFEYFWQMTRGLGQGACAVGIYPRKEGK